MPDPRDHRIDNVRALGILFVVLGHVWSAPEPLLKWILSFHMPAFFVLSGYVFSARSLQSQGMRDFVVRRTIRLMVPYFFWGLICAIPWILTSETASAHKLAKRVAGTLYSIPSADWNFNCTPIWFLACSVWVSALSAILTKLPPGSRVLASVAIFGMGVAASRWTTFYWPWNLNTALTGVFLFQTGCWLRSTGYLKKRPLPVFVLGGILVASISLALLNPTTINLSLNHLGNPMLFLVAALTGTLFLFDLAKRLPPCWWLNLVGQNTILILALNYWMYDFVHKLLGFVCLRVWYLEFSVQIIFFTGLIVFLRRHDLLLWCIGSGSQAPVFARR